MAATCAAGSVATLFLPWAGSGRADRSGFALARTVDALGLAASVPLRTLLIALWFTPLLAGMAWTLVALGRPRPAAVPAAVVAVVIMTAAVLVLRSTAVEARLGPWVAIVVTALALAGAVQLATRRG